VKHCQNLVVTLFLVLVVVCGPKSQNDFIIPGVDLYRLPQDVTEASATVDSGEAQPVVVTTAKSNPTAVRIHLKQGALSAFVTTALLGIDNTTVVFKKELHYNNLKTSLPMKLLL
jgi:hypothetical protein